MALPAQAIPARLTNMTPAGEKWSVQATRQFTQLVAQRVVMARITSVGHVLSVCLCDTSGSDDVHINDVLVKSGMAKKCQDQAVSVTADHRCINAYSITVCVVFMRNTTAVDDR